MPRNVLGIFYFITGATFCLDKLRRIWYNRAGGEKMEIDWDWRDAAIIAVFLLAGVAGLMAIIHALFFRLGTVGQALLWGIFFSLIFLRILLKKSGVG